eukprot:946620_1
MIKRVAKKYRSLYQPVFSSYCFAVAFRSLYFGHLCWNCYLLGMKVLVHRIPYQRIATGSMIWNLDMKLTEVEGINHLFELFEINLDLMKHPECVKGGPR